MKKILQTLFEGKSLTRAEAREAMDTILMGETKPEQVAAFLTALHVRGETFAELAGFLESLRAKALSVPVKSAELFDIVGTGGDGAETFNISTVTAFVLAAAGVKVAKHGNRSVSSKCGSADVLEALGIKINASPETTANAIDEVNLGFLFAPLYHPALAKVGPVRKALEVRTVFNLLGPLANPARVRRQVVGVYNPKLVESFAQLLRDSGSDEALVVSSDDGMDEISLSAPTSVAHLKAGDIKISKVTPEDFGVARANREALRGGDAVANAKLVHALLRGEERGPKRDVVLVNAGAGLVVAGKSPSYKEGAALAGKLLDDGSAARVLEALRKKQV